MKNYEKYADKIREYKGREYKSEEIFCDDFVVPHILNLSTCNGIVTCGLCRMLQMLWLLEEYEEPEVDWSKVEVDTPILVRDHEDQEWERRHFAKYENGDIYAWRDAYTSWTASHDDDMTWWRYAKLAESEEGEQK